MRKAPTRELFNYWNELRGTRSAPERRDIDPARIRHALASTFILETAGNDDFTFRLAGSHLCSAYCRELKGRSFIKLWHDKDRDAVGTLIKAATEDHAVALMTFTGVTRHGAELNFETMLLPLRHNGTTNTRLIGSMTAMEDPFWLGSDAILEQRICGLRLIWPDDHPADLASGGLDTGRPDSISIIARESPVETIAARHESDGSRRYAHLAVIDGGKN
jgi:hypothetical protein